MDYKKIFKSQSVRFAILSALKWVPDSIMVPLQYRIKLGRWPNLNEPKRYTEKLQVYKMKYRNPVMGQCVDKFEVREYVKEKGLEPILIPLLGVYEEFHDIDFNTLPDSFVLKTTDGGGGKNVFVCNEKTGLNISDLGKLVSSWINVKDVNAGREWAYTQIKKSRILVEKKLEPSNLEIGLVDYKFFCFDGVFQYMYVVTERIPGKQAKMSVYDKSFNKLDVSRTDELKCTYTIAKPDHFDEMVSIAERLSSGFPHVRVDLYNENGQIFFGELTFYDGSGYFQFDPDSFDLDCGKYFDINEFGGGEEIVLYIHAPSFEII